MERVITQLSFYVGSLGGDAKAISEFVQEQEILLLNNYLNSPLYKEHTEKGYNILDKYFSLEFAGSYDCHYVFIIEVGETEENFKARKLKKKNKKRNIEC